MAADKARVIMGLLTLGPHADKGARITDIDVFKKALDMFQEGGYTELDTARTYNGGAQEAFTREAGWKERRLQIATKVYPLSPGTHKPDVITQHFETSLNELGTDCVDIFYLHAPDRSVPFSETLQAVDKLYRAGKFKQLGLSNFASFEVAEVCMLCHHNNWVRPTVYQAIYNCIFRTIEPELIPACRRYGLKIVIYGPMAGGFLGGNITSKDADPQEGRFSKAYIAKLTRDRYFRDGPIEAARMIKEASQKHGLSPYEVAMRWVVHHSKINVKGGGDGIIIGFSNLDMLRDNLDYLEKPPLPDDMLEVVEQAWLGCKGQTDDYWQLALKYTYDTEEALFGKGGKS